MLEDRFTRGLFAGMIAWVPTFIINYTLKSLGISTLMYKDFMGTMVFGRLPTNIWENLFSYGAIIGFLSVLGGAFTLLIPRLGKKNHVLKGIIYSLSLWFIFYSITMLFKVPGLKTISLGTALGNFSSATVYGISMSLTFGWLERKVNQKSSSSSN